jgi:hypothetical protein
MIADNLSSLRELDGRTNDGIHVRHQIPTRPAEPALAVT